MNPLYHYLLELLFALYADSNFWLYQESYKEQGTGMVLWDMVVEELGQEMVVHFEVGRDSDKRMPQSL
jgi:hypothetical protein